MSDWKENRAEAEMKEAGKKIMADAAKKSAEKAAKKKVLFNYEVKIVSTGAHKQEDVDAINQALSRLKLECHDELDNLELKITKFVDRK